MTENSGSLDRVRSHFQFEKYGTNLRTEILAGTSTYLSLAYIFIVNPAILAKANMDPSAVLFATVCGSTAATLVMGFWANLPFAVAPGLSMNGFFAFVVCGILDETWQQGLGTVFISGLLCVLATIVGIRRNIISSIPVGLKQSITTSIGVFIAVIGLFLAKIVTYDGGVLNYRHISFDVFSSPYALVLYAGLIVAAVLGARRLHIPGGMIIAIIVAAGLCYGLKIEQGAIPNLMGAPLKAVGQLDLTVLFQPKFWSPILVFFILDFMEGVGQIVGLTSGTTMQDKDGHVPTIGKALYVDGGGTMLGSLLGTSSLIIFIESAIGIKAGGRTGLTAIVCAALMAASIIFSPVISLIPSEAAAGVLVYVGYLILPINKSSTGTGKYNTFDIVTSTFMGLIVICTFSLDKAMAVGFWAYFMRGMARPGSQNRQYWLGIIALILTFSIVWQLRVQS
jgi:adenine/guanine/hypoxanthine permease